MSKTDVEEYIAGLMQGIDTLDVDTITVDQLNKILTDIQTRVGNIEPEIINIPDNRPNPWNIKPNPWKIEPDHYDPYKITCKSNDPGHSQKFCANMSTTHHNINNLDLACSAETSPSVSLNLGSIAPNLDIEGE